MEERRQENDARELRQLARKQEDARNALMHSGAVFPVEEAHAYISATDALYSKAMEIKDRAETPAS